MTSPSTDTIADTTPGGTHKGVKAGIKVWVVIVTFGSLVVLLMVVLGWFIWSVSAVSSAQNNADEWRIEAESIEEIRSKFSASFDTQNEQYYDEIEELEKLDYWLVSNDLNEANVTGLFFKWDDPKDADWGGICPGSTLNEVSCLVLEVRTSSFRECPAGINATVVGDSRETFTGISKSGVETSSSVRIGIDMTSSKDEAFDLKGLECR